MKISLLATFFIIFSVLSSIISFAAGSFNVGVSPGTLDLGNLEAGSTKLVDFYIITPSEEALLVKLEAEKGNLDFFSRPSYKDFIYNYSEEDATPWVKVINNPVEIRPSNETLRATGGLIRGKEQISFLIDIPKNAEPGYHMLYIKPIPSASSETVGVIGSRVVALVSQDYGFILREPLALFKIWEGGMSFFGGLIGAVLTGVYVFKKYNVNFYRVANLVVVPVSFILILGRLANFVNQELVGKITDVSWCFYFANYLGCRHPYQLYSAFLHLILFIIVFAVYKFNKKNTFWTFILGYGILRFVTEFFRDEMLVFGITLWQYLSLIMIGIALYYLIKKK